MAKVYLSSTVVDLAAEREAVTRWLIGAHHQPVHSYAADNETVRESCLEDIARCDLFLLLLGHRYGFVPETDNPEGLSITHLEFRRAGELGLPRIVLMRTSVPDIQHSDLLDAVRNQRLQVFHAEVRQAVRTAEFKSEAELIAALSTGLQRTLDKLEAEQAGLAVRPEADAAGRPGTLPLKQPMPAAPAQGAGSDSRASGGWWTTLPGLLTGAAAVIAALTGLIALFVPQKETPPEIPPSPEQPAPSPPAPIASPAASGPAGQEAPALPRIVLAGPAEVSFEKYRPSTYTVLGVETLPRTSSHYVLRFRVRLLTRSSMDMNFWDSSFRLLIDGLPSAPDTSLNELVPGNAAKEALISYPVPYGARSLALRVIHHESLGEIADLPLRLSAGETAAEGIPAAPDGQSDTTGDTGAGAKVPVRQSP